LVTTPGASNQIRSVDRGRDLVWCYCRTLPAVDLDPCLHTCTGAVDISVTQRISTVEGFSLFFFFWVFHALPLRRMGGLDCPNILLSASI
jgi:hypothetical protein